MHIFNIYFKSEIVESFCGNVVQKDGLLSFVLLTSAIYDQNLQLCMNRILKKTNLHTQLIQIYKATNKFLMKFMPNLKQSYILKKLKKYVPFCLLLKSLGLI